MRRKRTRGRVYGPYKDRSGWRVVIRTAAGARESRVLATKAEATGYADGARESLEGQVVTVSEALDLFGEHLLERDVLEHSVRGIRNSVKLILPDPDLILLDIDEDMAKELYTAARRRTKPDGTRYAAASHRKALSRTREMMAWAVTEGLATGNPFAAVKGIGRIKRGKTQLSVDEARALTETCLRAGTPDATAPLICLWMGLRAGEVAAIAESDLDDRGSVLHVRGTKSAAADRRLIIPEVLRPLMGAYARYRPSGAKVSGWVLRQTKIWCEEAGVTVVTAHGLRGTHASLARSSGGSSVIVAASLGHAGTQVTEAHYISRESQDRAQLDAVSGVLSATVPQAPPRVVN